MSSPFSNIALSLSGGGYRAAAFHLGTLSILEEIKTTDSAGEEKSLLENVQIISTISGGTITGIMWALDKANDKSFPSSFNKLYTLLNDDKLLQQAFDKLKGKKDWSNTNKPKNLINAFADVYNECFFEEENFSKLLDSKKGIDTVVFNATEFTHGLQFRFQNTGKIGNGRLEIKKENSKNIKLGDILAASSCFPMAFEPIIFPNDFAASKDDKLIKNWSKKPIALMDGGAVDNQGIESLKIAIKRFEKKKKDEKIKIDTVIISDVSGKNIAPLKLDNDSNSNFNLSIKQVYNLALLTLISSIIGVIAAWYFSYSKPDMIWDFIYRFGIIIFTILATVLTLAIVFYRKLEKWISDLVNGEVKTANKGFSKNLKILKETPLPNLVGLSRIRITSTASLVYSIFMGRIRNLQYDGLYEDDDWKYRTIGNFIYSLQDPKRKGILPEGLTKIVDNANKMETTLWFNDGAKRLDDLIICGQLTICQKLIEFLDKQKKFIKKYGDTENRLPEIETLKKTLLEQREKFTDESKWLINKMKAAKTA